MDKNVHNAKYHSEEWIGQRFHHLTVLGIEHVVKENGQKLWYWNVRCDCGNEKSIRADYVFSGHSKTCGCGKRYDGALKHGETKSRLYMIWARMCERCNSDNPRYKRYNGRGIKVCDEWKQYTGFSEWARTSGYNDSMSIERIDNNGDYCPDNCKWIDFSLQARNRETTMWVEYNGTRMSLAEACEKACMPYKTVFSRIRYMDWPVEKALSVPVRCHNVKNG